MKTILFPSYAPRNWFPLTIVLVSTLVGCGSESDSGQPGSGGAPAGLGGASSGGSAPSGGVSGTGGGVVVVPTCSAERRECSSDLTQIVCDGEVVETCAPDQACANAECRPACEAARLSKNTVGCEYLAMQPETHTRGGCHALFVANASSVSTRLGLEWGGASTSLDVDGFAAIPTGSGRELTYTPLVDGELPAGQVAILFLSGVDTPGSTIACPIPAAVPGATASFDVTQETTAIYPAFRLTSTMPVVAYDIYPYGGAGSAITSASLLIPTSAWDTNYVAALAAPPSAEAQFPWLQVIAAEDETHVTLLPSADIVGGARVAPGSADVPVEYVLNQGEVLHLAQEHDLTGTVVSSTKPVGVVGGARCMSIPASASYCDAGHQMIPPVRALGHEYVGVRPRNRCTNEEEAPYRIVGAVDGTLLSYEPAAPAGAPSTIGAREIAEFATSEPFVVRSQDGDHPFYMSVHMTGASTVSGCDDFGEGAPGDPETVNVIPPAQFLTRYLFFTDPTYPETNLVFVRQRGPEGFEDVELDCAGVLTGWAPVGSSGEYEYTRLDLVRGNFEPQNGCDTGVREATSKAPFGITVWGWGFEEVGGVRLGAAAVSYGYPAGASVRAVTEVVVPPEIH